MQWSVQVKTLSNSNKWVPVWILEKSATLIKKIYTNRRAIEISGMYNEERGLREFNTYRTYWNQEGQKKTVPEQPNKLV